MTSEPRRASDKIPRCCQRGQCHDYGPSVTARRYVQRAGVLPRALDQQSFVLRDAARRSRTKSLQVWLANTHKRRERAAVARSAGGSVKVAHAQALAVAPP